MSLFFCLTFLHSISSILSTFSHIPSPPSPLMIYTSCLATLLSSPHPNLLLYLKHSKHGTQGCNTNLILHRQWFTLLAIRTRRLSIFQHPPVFNRATQNLLLFPAIIFALCIAIFWTYIPQLQSALNTSRVPAEHFFLPATFGLGVLLLDEGRKYTVRRWPTGFTARFAW